jgi:hypothetical protein
MKLSVWRHVCSFIVIVAMCVMGYLEQQGVGEAPSWFTGMGFAVVTQYLVEFWQSVNQKPKPPENGGTDATPPAG